MKILLLTLLLLLNLSATETSYCFEDSKLFLDKQNIKLILPISDWNLSLEHKSRAKLFYMLKNGNVYEDEELWCFYNEKKQVYHCDADVTDSGWLEFDFKKLRINIEELCTDDCGVHITPLLVLEDGSVMNDDSTNTSTNYIHEIRYPLGGGGNLNTMYPSQRINNEERKVWVKGYKCNFIFKEPKVIFYTIHEYKNTFPKLEEDNKLFSSFTNDIEGSDIVTLILSQSYRDIATMMHEEGFNSNWINSDDIELFVYSNNRALIKIKSIVRSNNKQSCLSGGYYMIQLENNKIKIKRIKRASKAITPSFSPHLFTVK